MVKDLKLEKKDAGYELCYCMVTPSLGGGIYSEMNYSYKEEAFGEGQLDKALKRFQQLDAMTKEEKGK